MLPSAHRRSIPNRMGIFGLHLSRNKSYGVSSDYLKKKTIEIKNSSSAFNKRFFVSKRGGKSRKVNVSWRLQADHDRFRLLRYVLEHLENETRLFLVCRRF